MRTALILLALALLIAAARPAAAPPVGPDKGAARAVAPAHPNAFYDDRQFHLGLQEALALPAAPRAGALLGGLVPHHILAGSMFSRFFVELEQQPPRTVILVGPNHDNRGARIATGRYAWTTPFGQADVDQAMVDRLVAAGLATVDDPALAPEHSVGSLMPYVKYHTPGARVVPLILHRDVSEQEIRQLAALIAPLLGPDCLLIASVDFSHYLTGPEAAAKDRETLAAIQAFDLAALYRMGPDHLDSPAALGLLMLTMQRLGAAGPEILGNTNSGVIIGSDLIETTSYFTFRYAARP